MLFNAVLALFFAIVPEFDFPAWLDGLKTVEKERTGLRLALSISERETTPRSGENLTAARLRLRQATDGRTSSGTITTSPAGWRKECSASDPNGGPSAHTIITAADGEHRSLFEATLGTETQRRGVVTRPGASPPGDAILAGRLATYLAECRFGRRVESGDAVEIILERGGEKLVLTTTRSAPNRVTRLYLERSLPGDSSPVRQLYEVEIGYEDGQITRLEEVMLVPAPYLSAAFRETVVRGREPAVPDPALTRLPFPKGAMVRDLRFKRPVEYVQAAQDPPADRLRALAEGDASGTPKVGDAAPQFSLKDDRGRDTSLASFRGKVILLCWYSSWTEEAARATREVERLLWSKLRSRGLQVLGIQIAEEGDPAAVARAYRGLNRITFPILLDNEATTFRLVGPGEGLPKIAVVDRQGKIRYAFCGWRPEGVTELVRELLSEPAPAAALKTPRNPRR